MTSENPLDPLNAYAAADDAPLSEGDATGAPAETAPAEAAPRGDAARRTMAPSTRRLRHHADSVSRTVMAPAR